MKDARKTFIFYEVGGSCRAEFRMADGEFHPTEDAVVLGTSEGETAEEALANLKRDNPDIQEYRTSSIVAREIGPPCYL